MISIETVGTIVVVGFLLWLAHAIIPMHPTVKRILDVVVIGSLAFWLLQKLGLLKGLH